MLTLETPIWQKSPVSNKRDHARKDSTAALKDWGVNAHELTSESVEAAGHQPKFTLPAYGEKPFYVDRKKHRDLKHLNARKFLEKVWGDYVRAGLLYQFNLRELDAPLVTAIHNYCNHRKIDAASLLPTKSVFVDRRVSAMPDPVRRQAMSKGLKVRPLGRAIVTLASVLNVSTKTITDALVSAKILTSPRPADPPRKPTLPKVARVKFAERHKHTSLAGLDIVAFLKAEYGPWLDGTLTRKALRGLDASAERAMLNFIAAGKPWPKDIPLPTLKELNDQAVAEFIGPGAQAARNMARIAAAARYRGVGLRS